MRLNMTFANHNIVIRLSTPSHIEKEMTILVMALCPRHNNKGISHSDYGDDIDHPEDNYFTRFGGYNAFRGMIYTHFYHIYEILGGEDFLPNEEIRTAVDAISTSWAKDAVSFAQVLDDYVYELIQELERTVFVKRDLLPQAYKLERLRRGKIRAVKNQGDTFWKNLHDPNRERLDISEAPMSLEVKEILHGTWSGIPHWRIED